MGDLSQLRVEHLIIHKIPVGTARARATPILSDVESPLDQKIRSFFQQQTGKSLTKYGREVSFQATPRSASPDAIRKFLLGQTDFVSASKDLAFELANVQGANVAEGMLTIVGCKNATHPALAVIKLEEEHGVRVHTDNANGKIKHSVEFIDDLLLSEETRLLQAGLFTMTGKTAASIHGVLSDGIAQGTHVAGFFRRFLGCEYTLLPEVATQKFYDAAEKFINSGALDADTKAKYLQALLVEMNSNESAVNPAVFARRHLDGPHRAAFIESLQKAQAPTSQFEKDVSLVKTRIMRIQYEFKSGITVLARPDNQHLTMSQAKQGQMRFQIVDFLSKLRGKK